jgi:hypothetical protein
VAALSIDAVVDGQQSMVSVQTDSWKHTDSMRRVQLTHRFNTAAFVRGKRAESRLPQSINVSGLQPLEDPASRSGFAVHFVRF